MIHFQYDFGLLVLSVLLKFCFSESIFFDGFLPSDKFGVRKARLEASLNQLFTFHSTFSEGMHVPKCAFNPSPVTAPQLFDSLRSAPSSLRGVPTPAFLVPAVIDALQDSEYASITAVVPGEADPFCAGAASKCGGVILTNDSDLLVYDLGEQGAVAFFSQLELRRDDESSKKCEVFRTSISQPIEIAQRLGLEDLRRFSFELLRDPSISLTEIVKRAKQPVPEPLPVDVSRQKTFHDFCKDYDPKTFDFGTELMEKVGSMRKAEGSQFLDPRISELILTSSSSPSIYLPLLIEDPSKAAAWNISRVLRHFAYSCLKSQVSDSSPETILEYCRRGERIVPEVIQTFSKKKVISYTKQLAAGLETFSSLFCDFSSTINWRTFALSEILHHYAENQKKSPSRSALAYSITGHANRKISWHDIHLSAQMEAVLYSLRMLKQILNYPRPLPNSQTSDPRAKNSSSSNDSLRLRAILETLPPLNQLLPSRLELATQSSSSNLDIDHLLDRLASHLQPPPSPRAANIEEENISPLDDSLTNGFQTVPTKRDRQSNQARHMKTPVVQNKNPQKLDSNNMFNALLQD